MYCAHARRIAASSLVTVVFGFTGLMSAHATSIGAGEMRVTFSGGSCPVNETLTASSVDVQDQGSVPPTNNLSFDGMFSSPGPTLFRVFVNMIPIDGSPVSLSISTNRDATVGTGSGDAASNGQSTASITDAILEFSGSDADCNFSGVAVFGIPLPPEPSTDPESPTLPPEDSVPDDDADQQTKEFGDSVDKAGAGRTVATIDQLRALVKASVTPRGKNNGAQSGLMPVAGGVRYQGVGAGDGYEYPFALWATYDYVDFDDDTNNLGMDGDTNALLVGGDLSPWEGTAFGVALGYEKSDIDTLFNGGDLEIDGFTVVPYMAFYLSDDVGVDFDLTADFSFGYSTLDIDRRRTVGGVRVDGSTDSERVFASGNLTAGRTFGALYLSGNAGLLAAREDIDGFVDSNGTVISDQETEFGQLSLGGEAAYRWDGFEPYANATWQYAYQREESTVLSDDVNSARIGLGLRYFGARLAGSVGYSTVVGRDDFDSDAFSVQLRADF